MATPSKVHNNGTEEYVEEFDGRTVKIPGNGYIEMGRREAIKFRGKHPGVHTKGPLEGTSIRKPLSLEHGEIDDAKFVNQMTGEEFKSQEALNASLNAYKGMDTVAKLLQASLGNAPKVETGIDSVPKATTTQEKVYVCSKCAKDFTGNGAKMVMLNHMKGCKNDTSSTGNDN